LQAIDILGL